MTTTTPRWPVTAPAVRIEVHPTNVAHVQAGDRILLAGRAATVTRPACAVNGGYLRLWYQHDDDTPDVDRFHDLAASFKVPVLVAVLNAAACTCEYIPGTMHEPPSGEHDPTCPVHYDREQVIRTLDMHQATTDALTPPPGLWWRGDDGSCRIADPDQLAAWMLAHLPTDDGLTVAERVAARDERRLASTDEAVAPVETLPELPAAHRDVLDVCVLEAITNHEAGDAHTAEDVAADIAEKLYREYGVVATTENDARDASIRLGAV